MSQIEQALRQRANLLPASKQYANKEISFKQLVSKIGLTKQQAILLHKIGKL